MTQADIEKLAQEEASGLYTTSLGAYEFARQCFLAGSSCREGEIAELTEANHDLQISNDFYKEDMAELRKELRATYKILKELMPNKVNDPTETMYAARINNRIKELEQ